MTGPDFSAPTVGQARSLAAAIGADARFVQVQTDVIFQHNITHVWNRGLGEIVTALLDADMQITALAEHDSVPWEALPGKMERTGGDERRLADQPWRLPHSYTLQAVKCG